MGPGFLGSCPHAGADSLWWGQTLAVSGPVTTPPLAVGAPTGATLFPQLGWMHQDVWSQIFICLGSPSIHLWLSRSLLFTHTYTAKFYICLCTPPSIVSFWCCVLFECALLQKQQLATQRVCLLHPRLLPPPPFFSSFFSNFSSFLSSIWPLPPLCSSNNIH